MTNQKKKKKKKKTIQNNEEKGLNINIKLNSTIWSIFNEDDGVKLSTINEEEKNVNLAHKRTSQPDNSHKLMNKDFYVNNNNSISKQNTFNDWNQRNYINSGNPSPFYKSNTFQNNVNTPQMQYPNLNQFSGMQQQNMNNFTNATNAELTFYNCLKLKEIDLSNANMPLVTSAKGMFGNCQTLEKLDLSNIKLNSNKSLNGTFANLYELTSINLSGFEDTALEDFATAFGYCYKLKNIDLSSLNATKVNNMSMTFFADKELETLDLSGVKSNKVTNMINTFNTCRKLRIIYISNDWSNASLASDKKTSTFFNCDSLEGYTSSKASGDYAKSKDKGGYFTIKA